jgi:hypothetical protein
MDFSQNAEAIFDARSAPAGNGESTNSTDLLAPAAAEWTDVARVANLAEAGFIADELTGLGFQARVQQLNEFSAARDRWSDHYLIRVPAESAAAAGELVRAHLLQDPSIGRTLLSTLRTSVADGGEHAAWKPVVSIVLVAVTSFMLGHQLSEGSATHHVRENSLGAALAQTGGPFVSQIRANQPQYRLSLDQSHRIWTLSTDRDHDGVFESSRQFTASGDPR